MNDANTIDVLCVDDDVSFLQMEKDFLERCGFIAVDTADSVPVALDKMKMNRYDAIVSDYQMPGPNGIDLLKFIRSQGNAIPFIFLTGRGDNELAIEALTEGATFYVEKGGNPQAQFVELADMIKSLANHLHISVRGRAASCRPSDIGTTSESIVMIIDVNGRIVDCNRRSETMMGYSRCEMIGRKVMEFVVLGKAQPLIDFENPSVDRELAFGRDIKVLRKGSRELHAIISSYPFKIRSANKPSESFWVISNLHEDDEADGNRDE